MDGVAAFLETNMFLFILNFNDGGVINSWNIMIALVPPLYLYTIQMRMMTSHKAKYNWWQVGPTESETLIGLIILLPAFFGRDVYETEFLNGVQLKYLAGWAYLLVQALMIMDCVVETLMKDPKASLRYYLPMIPMQALFLIGCRSDSLGFLGDFAFYNLMFQILFHL
jgi:hypothetical protein